MKNKQIIGIIIAGIVFIFVCIASMLSNVIMDKYYDLLDTDSTTPSGKYIGMIRIEGTIMSGSSAASLLETGTYDHEFILESIKECEEDKNNKGILLYINSPGGTVNASDEVYLRLMKYKEKTERPIWVYMGDQACSGGYYIAMAGDKVIANRNTWTGSIGVYIELVNYAGLCEKLGIDSVYFVTGPNKTMGSGTEELTEEQKAIFQSLVDEPYAQFLDIVCAGRSNMAREQVETAADGRIYTAKQALEIGLIDEIKTYDETTESMLEELGKGLEIYEYTKEVSIFDQLMMKFGKNKTKSESEVLIEYMKNDGSGEAMYYAMPGQY